MAGFFVASVLAKRRPSGDNWRGSQFTFRARGAKGKQVSGGHSVMPKNGRARNLGLLSDPEWEKSKSSCRSLDHDDAVQESFFLQKQFRWLWSDRMAASPVDLNHIIRTLNEKKIPFVLTGAHAIGGWTGRPRDTYDVDILVKGGRIYTRAVNALKALYPQLETRTFVGLTAFFIPGETESVIDV